MFLTLFLACPLLLVSWYLGFSSLKFRITFGEWINQPKAIAFLVCMALCVSIIFIDLNGLLSTASDPVAIPVSSSSEPTVSQPVELPITDYVEILRNSEEYDGLEVRVAGRIAELGYDSNKYSFYFMDRLGFLSIGKDFEVRLSREFAHFVGGEGVSDYYVKNQYVLVQGVWSHSELYPALHNAKVIATGKEAQQIDQVFIDEWVALGLSYSNLPIIDYMDLADAPERYLGERVRVVGQVQSVGKNAVAGDKSISLQNRDNRLKSVSFSLQGCPPEMQNECVEGEYLVISCLVTKDEWRSVWFSDCFVECVGDEAESIYKQFYAE